VARKAVTKDNALETLKLGRYLIASIRPCRSKTPARSSPHRVARSEGDRVWRAVRACHARARESIDADRNRSIRLLLRALSANVFAVAFECGENAAV
jgi:hypothetical protein